MSGTSDRYARFVDPAFVRVLGVLGYGRVFTRAEGVYVWDEQERRYLDLLAGFGSANIGHNHPRLIARLRAFFDENALNLSHTGPAPYAAGLAEALAQRAGAPLEMSLFSNGGAEAVETAMKVARAATKRPRIVSCRSAYHGLTLGTLSLQSARRMRAPFEPLLPGCTAIDFDDPGALERELSSRDVAAFVVEPVQIEGGVRFPSAQHDRRRGIEGASERAWHAVGLLRDSAPHAGKQVHVMTVLMHDNVGQLDALLTRSGREKVGHCATLLSTRGFRRAHGASMPSLSEGAEVASLWKKHHHFRMFGDYIRSIEPFLAGEPMPECHAGVQSFNIDHLGNVSQCIEKIDSSFGNVRAEPLSAIHRRMADADPARGCQQCWTACRGFNQVLGEGGSIRAWNDLFTRMRSV